MLNLESTIEPSRLPSAVIFSTLRGCEISAKRQLNCPGSTTKDAREMHCRRGAGCSCGPAQQVQGAATSTCPTHIPNLPVPRGAHGAHGGGLGAQAEMLLAQREAPQWHVTALVREIHGEHVPAAQGWLVRHGFMG